MKKLIVGFLMLLIMFNAFAQDYASYYVAPKEPDVKAKLEQWKDLKFGMIIHWGLYAVPGIVESWSICSEDEDWIPRDSTIPYDDYKQWYWNLSKEFNPVDFDPDQWASVAREAGMKYVVFTTKHHDGFALFDTKYSDFSIAKGPFAKNPKADALKYVFEAFRKQNMMIGAYFSKPDWHSQDYWWSRYATPDRHVNYKIDQHPQRWENFAQFVHNQIGEITSNYGKVDILWLDGGWVRPPEEDINMDVVAKIARQNQPGILIVDRTVGGEYENYQTPEKQIPEKQLANPWETCVPLSKDWGYVPNAKFKSANEVIAMMMEIVAKGGSLLLGIGPTPQGLIEPEVVKILEEIGTWMKANGEAIYNTRCLAHYQDENIWFTTSKDGKYVYALCPGLTDGKPNLSWTGHLPAKGSKIQLLGSRGPVYYKVENGKVNLRLPYELSETGRPFVLKIEVEHPAYNDLNKNGRCDVYENPTQSIEMRVEDLLQQMTLEEKVGQLAMTMGWSYYEREGQNFRLTDKFEQDMGQRLIGGSWAVMRADPWTQKTLDNGLNPSMALEVSNAMQRWVREHTRLGIPLFLAEECPHGHMAIGTTVIPTALGRASSFNKQLENDLGEAVAKQTALQGANVAFGPVLDISRDPRWSRMEEGYGEDPVLAAQMGGAYARGLVSGGTLPVMKHLSAYGVSEGGHNGASSHVGTRELLSQLSLPFRQGPEVGGVMTAYNDIDGVPCSANEWLIKNILRGAWHFDGVVVSDLYAINGLVSSRMAADYKEAAAQALKAGVDIDLGASCYSQPLVQALKEGLVSEKELDEAVRHVLMYKFKLGLFDKSYADFKPSDNEKFKTDFTFDVLNRQAATESVVLLRNDESIPVLPLSKDVKRVAVIGPNADNIYNMLGDYTAPQAAGEVVTLLQGIRNKLPNAEIRYVKGCAIRDMLWEEIDKAVATARWAEVVIVALGGSSARDFRTSYKETGAADATAQTVSDMESGEGFDRATLSLMGYQEQLMEALAKTGQPIVLVMIQGRPLDLSWADYTDVAILNAWYPGAQGGNALADLIFGDANPSGKLPVSYPRSVGQLPIYYNASNHRNNYTDESGQPLYPFGFGLSYTTFSFTDMNVAQKTDSVTVSFTLTNTGDRDGAEVAQLYLRQEKASVVRPERQLIAFEKVFLKRGESKRVTMRLSKDDFSFMDIDGKLKFEPSEYTLMLGSSSQNIHLEKKIILD
ncbi:MAG: alpha-L-fucosidase [Bacteroidales bacterium]|nr:alpha-L-fucosidase [Bacteroidales bacterium]